MEPTLLNRQYIQSTTSKWRYRLALLTWKLPRFPRFYGIGAGSEQSRRTLYMIAGT